MLVPVLTKVAVARDGSTITFADGTGNYSVGNPGGYGAPNADIPTIVGFRARYWPDTNPYGHLVSDSESLLSGLFGAGFPLSLEDLGADGDAFAPGVHHILYYPLEEVDTLVTLTNGSKLVTVTAGTGVDSGYAEAYKGLMFWNGTDLGSKIYLIDQTAENTDEEFYLTEEWAGDDVENYEVMRATEADLKVLVIESTNGCVVARIGKITDGRCLCDPEEIKKLMAMVLQLFSAQSNFACANYQGAHNKIVGVELRCNECQTVCSCS